MPLRSFSIKYFWKGMRFVSHLWFEMDNWKKTRSAGCREIHFVKLIACYENLSLDVCATIIGPKLHRICTGRPATPCFVLIRESDSPGPYQFRVERSLPDERPHTEKDVEQWAGRAHVRAACACEPPARTQIEIYTHRLPEDELWSRGTPRRKRGHYARGPM